jgi:UDPglucose 6-dehydrogenase
MEKEILLGFVGLGVVGGAVRDAFAKKFKTVGYDIKTSPDTKEELLNADMIFLSLPTPTVNGAQDQGPLEVTCQYLSEKKYPGIVIVKSTVLPGTCDRLVAQYGLRIVHNPEFLTAKTPLADFMAQDVVLLSGTDADVEPVADIYQRLLIHAAVWSNDSLASTECAKYTHNLFLATKVGFLNEMYQVCEKVGVKYEEVIQLALSQDKIGETHTKIPNNEDAKGQILFGFGGMCFPKDIQALVTWGKTVGLELIQLNGTNDANLKIRPETKC